MRTGQKNRGTRTVDSSGQEERPADTKIKREANLSG